MIILEGPDGGGKTTLLERLLGAFPSIARHERACTSLGGPLIGQALYDWAHDDVWSWARQPLSFYDRHPLLSEYVYGPIIRGDMDPRFHTTSLRRRLAHRALVIVCLPPLRDVRRSVSAEGDMPGVSTHIDALWHSYASLRASWPSSTGLIFYDYTNTRTAQSTSLDGVLAAIHSHRVDWRTLHELI